MDTAVRGRPYSVGHTAAQASQAIIARPRAAAQHVRREHYAPGRVEGTLRDQVLVRVAAQIILVQAGIGADIIVRLAGEADSLDLSPQAVVAKQRPIAEHILAA